MKNFRNALFYIITIGLFSGLLYFFIRTGKSLEKPGTSPVKVQVSADSWHEFIDTLHHNITHPLALLILQMVTIILVARLFGWFCKKIGQPSVVGEIAAGIFLGPSLLGMYFPEVAAFLFPKQSLGNLQFLSQIGLILFMFIIGMELDLKELRTKAQEAVVISHASIILPFALGVGLALYIYQEFAPAGISFLSFSLFTGIALSVTAFPVLARIVQERGMSKTRLGMMVITCAATDDITAWCILAAVIAIVKAGSFVSSLYTLALAIGYVLFMLRVVRPFLARIGEYYSYREGLTKSVVTMFFLMLFASAYITEIIGIHALFGAFMAGVIMPSNLNFRNFFIEKVEDVSMVLLLPLFFVFTGLRTQIGLLNSPHLWAVTGLITLAAVLGKFVGSAFAARFVKQSWRDSLTIGALMNTRGLMELVVLNIGYDIGVLSPEIFAMMVIMALATTCMTGPALDLIERLLPVKDRDAAIVTEPSRFDILIAFASPVGGRKMVRLANLLIPAGSGTITALHLTPSSSLNQVNTEVYQEETFRPIGEEAQLLSIPVTKVFKPSLDINHDIVETANFGHYDMLMIGIGHSVFEGTVIGKILGITSKIITPARLIDSFKGKENLFHTDVFDEKTAQIIKHAKMPVGVLIDKHLEAVERVFVPLFSAKEKYLLQYVANLLGNEVTQVVIADSFGIIESDQAVAEQVRNLQATTSGRISVRQEKVLEKDFLEQQDLMVIGLDSWKTAVESHSLWLSFSPSVLIIRG